MKNKIKILVSAALLLAMAASVLAGCQSVTDNKNGNVTDINTENTETAPGGKDPEEQPPVIYAENLMAGITPAGISGGDEIKKEDAAKAAGFAVRLFQACSEEGENTLVSPLSVLAALAMTANGAEGETLSQMEQTLGLDKDSLNGFFRSYMKAFPNTEKCRLNLANSIWFTDDPRFTVVRDFLQTNADYFGADIYKAPFDDKTCQDINNWVCINTGEMIPRILDEIPAEAVMYLVNALAFEAEWENAYYEDQVREATFTLENGETRRVEFMYGEESRLLKSENATGFVKSYRGGKYAFAALLPDEGISISDYIASLDGETLAAMLSEVNYETVQTAIPKFEREYDTEMSEVLKLMGMPDAFDHVKADFSGLGSSSAGNIAISRVLHKTFISVGEKGTRAGAATAVEMTDECAPIIEHKVFLDRPFVYMLIDTETNIPFFIGSMTDVGA